MAAKGQFPCQFIYRPAWASAIVFGPVAVSRFWRTNVLQSADSADAADFICRKEAQKAQ
jgi:hypothetical protein